MLALKCRAASSALARIVRTALGGPPAWLRTCSPVSIVIAPSQMSKTLFFFACALCVVSAFVQTGTPLRGARRAPANSPNGITRFASCRRIYCDATGSPAQLRAKPGHVSASSTIPHPVFLPVLAAPAQKVPMARATAPGMRLEESDMLMSGLAAAGTLLATSNGDFGGYTIPVIGLALLAAIIGILAGPVEN